MDLSAFTTGSDIAARRATAKKLAESCHPNGCVGITGRGVPRDLLTQTFDMARIFFELPAHEKRKAPHPKGPVPHRGYSALGMEKAYTKEDLETNDDTRRDSLRKITDCKVVNQFLPENFSLTIIRRPTKSAAKRTTYSTIFGFFLRVSCPVSVNSRQSSTGAPQDQHADSRCPRPES